jgi:uncharacterized protein
MGFPRKLKDMGLFNEGLDYLGDVASVTLPLLGRVFEEYRGAGMMAPVKIDMGMQALEMEWTAGGPLQDVLGQFGTTQIDGVLLRFSGAYQDDSTGAPTLVDVITRGRHETIEMGEQKMGEAGEFKVKTALSYYRLDWNGSPVIEIDILNNVFIVGGVDRNAEISGLVR